MREDGCPSLYRSVVSLIIFYNIFYQLNKSLLRSLQLSLVCCVMNILLDEVLKIV